MSDAELSGSGVVMHLQRATSARKEHATTQRGSTPENPSRTLNKNQKNKCVPLTQENLTWRMEHAK